MFPFQTGPNLSFQNFDTGDQFDQNNINDVSEYLILPENNTHNINSGKRGGRKSRASTSTHDINNDNNNNNNDDCGKKIVHREIERQRRQEMSNLFASLRTILPAEYIRGKRSVSDHVAQAVKYIKEMEKNVKELGEKRDQLRKSVGSCSSSGSSSRNNNEGGGGSESGSSNFLPGSVSIHQVKGGVEIEISVSSQDEGFSLASMLEVVFEEGLSVTSCSSANVNGRVIHNLTCEVNNIACVDVYWLQQRLMDLVC